MYSFIDFFFIFCAQYLFILVPIIALFYFFRSLKREEKSMAAYAIILFPLIFIAGKIAGYLYYDPRPFISEHVIPLISYPAVNGFPSGHTIFCASFAVFLWPFHRKAAMWLWLITLMVGAARVYVGVHHWIDIVASILITVIVGCAVWKSKVVPYVSAKVKV